ncbi:MAG TPA: hypothetical protein RMH99_18330 [Sandaracinaceae bacterium LLY-WYZ-13_1]|nr:hypothetical protein [Sandaracinaceae bacterium LLY-WYZ-13_1]
MRRIHRPTRALTHLALTLGALSLAGCNGAFWGNLVVLGITVGIFFGTLGLGRSAPSSAEASTSTQSGRSS